MKMHIACECLNVIIESIDADILSFNEFNSLNDQFDVFFFKELGELKSVKITRKLPKFVRDRQCGSWIIHQCLFCGQDIYACSENSKQNSIIFDKLLMIDFEDISEKTKSANYSPFFKILINHADYASDLKPENNYETKLPREAIVWLDEQASLIEKRIQSYSNSQYKELENLKRRICQDNELIFRKSKCVDLQDVKSTAQIKENKSSSIKQSPSIFENVETPVYDSDEVFFLDDVDIKKSNPGYFVEHIPDEPDIQEKNLDDLPINLMSRSLPVPVPQFLSNRDIAEKDLSPEVPTDIAASIEALARSLHGDKIFGELPPPRYSTTKL